MDANQGILQKMGYDSTPRQVILGVTVGVASLVAIAGVAAGIFAMHEAYPSADALLIQAAALGGLALALSCSFMASKKIPGHSKPFVLLATITALVIPVIYAYLGMQGLEDPFEMLKMATGVCGGLLGAVFVGSFATVVHGIATAPADS